MSKSWNKLALERHFVLCKIENDINVAITKQSIYSVSTTAAILPLNLRRHRPFVFYQTTQLYSSCIAYFYSILLRVSAVYSSRY